MEVEHSLKKKFITVCPKGEFTMNNVYTIKSFFRDFMEKGCRRFAIDLSGTTYLDSAGVGVLVKSHRDSMQQGGFFFLYGGSEDIKKTLHTLNIEQLIPHFESFEKGWKYFDSIS